MKVGRTSFGAGWLRSLLPEGSTLPIESWRARHHAILILGLLHAIALPAYALVQGYGLAHALVEGGAILPLVAIGYVAGERCICGWRPARPRSRF